MYPRRRRDPAGGGLRARECSASAAKARSAGTLGEPARGRRCALSRFSPSCCGTGSLSPSARARAGLASTGAEKSPAAAIARRLDPADHDRLGRISGLSSTRKAAGFDMVESHGELLPCRAVRAIHWVTRKSDAVPARAQRRRRRERPHRSRHMPGPLQRRGGGILGDFASSAEATELETSFTTRARQYQALRSNAVLPDIL